MGSRSKADILKVPIPNIDKKQQQILSVTDEWTDGQTPHDGIGRAILLLLLLYI